MFFCRVLPYLEASSRDYLVAIAMSEFVCSVISCLEVIKASPD